MIFEIGFGENFKVFLQIVVKILSCFEIEVVSKQH